MEVEYFLSLWVSAVGGTDNFQLGQFLSFQTFTLRGPCRLTFQSRSVFRCPPLDEALLQVRGSFVTRPTLVQREAETPFSLVPSLSNTHPPLVSFAW